MELTHVVHQLPVVVTVWFSTDESEQFTSLAEAAAAAASDGRKVTKVTAVVTFDADWQFLPGRRTQKVALRVTGFKLTLETTNFNPALNDYFDQVRRALEAALKKND